MSKYIRLYEALCPDDPISKEDPRRHSIIAEMRAVVTAKTAEDAAWAVEWWEVWPNPQHKTALEFVIEARTKYATADAAGKPE
jgi:hypothetical protein